MTHAHIWRCRLKHTIPVPSETQFLTTHLSCSAFPCTLCPSKIRWGKCFAMTKAFLFTKLSRSLVPGSLI